MMRVGIVGTGYIANFHMEILQRLKDVEVVVCSDADRNRAEGFSQIWDIPKACDSLEELVETEGLQVVHVLVPPDRHYSVAKTLIQRGVGVFLEKPMAETAAECNELVDLARGSGVVLGVNQNSLFHPAFVRLKRDIAAGVIGRVHQVVSFQSGPLGQLDAGMFSHWMFRKPGNVLLEQGPHLVAQVRDLLGDVVDLETSVTGERQLGHRQVFFDRWQASARCERGGALLHLSFGSQYYPESRLEVSGQDGSIQVDFLKNLYLVQKKSLFPDYLDPLANSVRYGGVLMRGASNFADYAFSKLGIRGKRDPFFLSMNGSLEAFYDGVGRNMPPPVSGDDGANVVEFCEKWIKASGAEGNEPPDFIEPVRSDVHPEILITGATGFIGRKLVAHFVSRGIPVRVLVRSRQGLSPQFFDSNVEIFQGNLNDMEGMRRSVSGVRTVFHLAHSIGQTWEEFRRINLEGTRSLAEACIKEGVEDFVFTSTIAVYCYGDVEGGRVDEEAPIDGQPEKRNHYARSKILLEEMLFEMKEESGLPLVLFRPGIVVGEGGSPYHSGVGLWTRDNVCAYWGSGKNSLPFVLVDDVCAALAGVVDTAGLSGEVFNLVGDVRPCAREYIEQLRMYSGRDIKAFPYPTMLCFASDCFKYLVKALTGAHKDALLSYRDLANRAILADFDNHKPKERLGWRPCREVDAFLEAGIGWAFDGQRRS